MKITKKQLQEMVRKEAKRQLKEQEWDDTDYAILDNLAERAKGLLDIIVYELPGDQALRIIRKVVNLLEKAPKE